MKIIFVRLRGNNAILIYVTLYLMGWSICLHRLSIPSDLIIVRYVKAVRYIKKRSIGI